MFVWPCTIDIINSRLYATVTILLTISISSTYFGRWPGHRQAASSVLYTTSCKHSLVLLRMGEIIARNMLSWFKLLIKLSLLHLVSCLLYQWCTVTQTSNVAHCPKFWLISVSFSDLWQTVMSSVTTRYVLICSAPFGAWRWPGHRQAASSVLYTTSCKHSLVLLRMGEIIARNMLSWLKLLIKLSLLHLVDCLFYYKWDTLFHYTPVSTKSVIVR